MPLLSIYKLWFALTTLKLKFWLCESPFDLSRASKTRKIHKYDNMFLKETKYELFMYLIVFYNL